MYPCRDIQLSVKEIKSFCTTNVANPYSIQCELPVDYAFSGLKIVFFRSMVPLHWII
jgi:hypothetical protein